MKKNIVWARLALSYWAFALGFMVVLVGAIIIPMYITITSDTTQGLVILVLGFVGIFTIVLGISIYDVNKDVNKGILELNSLVTMERTRAEKCSLSIVKLTRDSDPENLAKLSPVVVQYAMQGLARTCYEQEQVANSWQQKHGIDNESYESYNQAFKDAKKAYWELAEVLEIAKVRQKTKKWKNDLPPDLLPT